MNRLALALGAATAALMIGEVAMAAPQPISTRQSFRIGGGSSVLCLAQGMATHASLKNMFDRGWEILCRDAAVPIGSVHALRLGEDDPAERLRQIRAGKVTCKDPGTDEIENVGQVSKSDCTLNDNPAVRYSVSRERVYPQRFGAVRRGFQNPRLSDHLDLSFDSVACRSHVETHTADIYGAV